MAAPTPSQTVGPYFSLGLAGTSANELVAGETPGAVRVSGQVLDGAGDPVADAVVELWQADEEGRHRPNFGWGRCGCDADGRFSFTTVKPGRVDGQAPHLTVMVFARGLLKPVLTRMYFPDEEEANADDPILSALDRAATLVARPRDADLEFDVRLQGERETVFFVV
ncbi:MAG: protocatechuate 3,4-dioxygenase subunit alpha [Actinomycetota bacterium]|nr:protocatechuate 3,4-dioxygenase subunit alpha [Actinomycetota bacterium]